MNKWICTRPWQMLEFFNYNNKFNTTFVLPCCHAWLKFPNMRVPYILTKKDVMDFWNGNIMQEFRRTILNDSYNLCNTSLCPLYKLIDFEPDEQIEDDIKNNRIILDHGPKILGYSSDRSCNLSCKSCRNEFTNTEAQSFNTFLECIDDNVTTLKLMGSGEVLYSPTTLNFLRTFNKLQYPSIKNIHIVTNGTLFNESMWNSFSEDCKKTITKISVSIDATTTETYQIIRGFDFDTLKNNLNFIKSLNKIFRINFVVQSRNIQELNMFCNYGKELNVNILRIDKITDWQHLNKEQWNNIKLDENSDIYKEQVELLKQFIIEKPQIKVLTNLIDR